MKMQHWVPDPRKSEVENLLKPVKREERRRSTCLFVVDENGRRCGSPVETNCHVIPKSSVLEELKDKSSGKVLELLWGVARWGYFYITSSMSNPINFGDSDSFEPQHVVTNDACVRWFACKQKGTDHDGQFNPVDVIEPDFEDPLIRLVCMYRAVLYESDLCRLGQRFLGQYDKEVWRRPDGELHVRWHRLQSSVLSRAQWTEDAANRLGKIWLKRDTQDWQHTDVVSGEVLSFRSKLKFAASVYHYGKGMVVAVYPDNEDRHKMAVLHLSEDAESVCADKEWLIELASATEDSPDYGVDVLRELMTNGAGAVAASPQSYSGLSDEEKNTINQMVARASGAEIAQLALAKRQQPTRPMQRRRWRKG